MNAEKGGGEVKRGESTDDRVQSTDNRVRMAEEVRGGADLVFHVSGVYPLCPSKIGGRARRAEGV